MWPHVEQEQNSYMSGEIQFCCQKYDPALFPQQQQHVLEVVYYLSKFIWDSKDFTMGKLHLDSLITFDEVQWTMK